MSLHKIKEYAIYWWKYSFKSIYEQLYDYLTMFTKSMIVKVLAVFVLGIKCNTNFGWEPSTSPGTSGSAFEEKSNREKDKDDNIK